MSRTGVGVRVLIDGAQLDDGCFDWSRPAPGTLLRRNLSTASRPGDLGNVTIVRGVTWDGVTWDQVTANSASHGLRQDLNSLLTEIPNGATLYTSWEVGNATAGPVTVAVDAGDGPNPDYTLAAGQRLRISASQTLADWTGWRFVDLAVRATGIPVLVRQIVTDTAPTGIWFDGASADTATELYDWTGAAHASPSIATAAGGPVVPQGVYASDGLSVTWGRPTTIDQPEASTCSFRVTDDPGGATVLQTLRLGSRVDVYADAVLTGDPEPTNAFDDPSFDAELRAQTANATAVRTQNRAETAGGWSAQITPADRSALGSVILPPGPIQPEGTNPAAWIDLDSTAGGETWTISARFWAAAGVTVQLRPVAYSGPYMSAATVLPFPATVTGNGGWQDVTVRFSPGLVSAWIGLRVDVSGGITWDQLDPAQTWDSLDPGATWDSFGDVWIDQVAVLAPVPGPPLSVLVFSGRITDLEGQFDPAADQPAMDVTATDFLGDLGNRYIGTEPFPAESVTARIARILGLAARPGEAPIQVEIPATFGPVIMSWDDVDHTAAAELLTEIGTSVDGVLWSATHPVIGPFVRLEDPSARIALYELELIGGIIRVIAVDSSADPAAPPEISACDVLRDPVRFASDVSDLATRVSVSWLAQTVDDEGNPTTDARRVDVEDREAESYAGVRAVNVDSILTTAGDAERVADQLIARLGASWRISGLVVADSDFAVPDATAARTLVMLLDGVTRGGQPLLLTDLPDWSPTGVAAPVYLEGGSYAFVAGGWELDLIVSRAAGQGQNATWDQIPNDPAWIWDAWDPALTWDDLRGVSA